MAILKTEDLTYQYSIGTPFEKTAVDHVNLEIEEGAFVGIIGHTGSGKSTLIQHFNGLIRPTSGKIYLDVPRLLTLSNPSYRFSLWIEGELVEVRIKEDGSIRGEDGAVFFWEGNGECCCFEIYPSSNAAVPPQKELALAAGGGVPYHRGRCSTRKDSDVIL